MRCRYSGTCDRCGGQINEGDECTYNRDTRRISHPDGQCTKQLLSEVDADRIAAQCHFRPFAEVEGIPEEWKREM